MRRGLWLRFAFFSVTVVFGLTVAMPVGQAKPEGPNEFPLMPLWSALRTQLALAADPRPETPAQGHGGGHGLGRASTSDTRADGGNGRARSATSGALAEQAPLAPQERPEWTTSARTGYDLATSQRLAAESTAASDVYANTDGSYTRIVSTAPVNYQAGDGSWQRIDSRLVRTESGRWQVAANSVGIAFAGFPADARQRLGADGDPLGSMELGRVTLPSGGAVGWTLVGASLPDPVVSGGTATYAGVLPSTDVVLEAFHSGAKETLVVHSADAPASWLFKLDLDGLSPSVDETGGIAFRDGSGAVVARMPSGYMEDSNVHPRSGEGEVSWAVAYELTTLDGQPAVRVAADVSWLRDPARVFPVRIDPTTVTVNTSTYVQSTILNTDVSGQTELRSGQSPESSSIKAWSLLKFPDFSSSLLGNKMTSAKLALRVFWSGNCGLQATVTVSETTSAWSPNTVRFANPPSLGTAVAGGVRGPSGSVCHTNLDPNNPYENDWWEFDFNAAGLDVLNRWTSGTATNHGLAVQTPYSGDGNWIKMSSVNTSYPPKMEITYTPNVAPVVNSQYPTHGYASPTLTPELAVKAEDDDAYPSAMTYQFRVYDPADTTNPLADSGWISSPSYKVPSGVLSWSKAYAWTVFVSDGKDISAAQPPNVFTTTVPQAPITSALSQNADKGFSTQAGNYTTSAVDASVPGVGPPLAISRAYNSRDARVGQAFGLGWASILDAEASVLTDPGTSTPRAVTITYPTGQDVTFGRDNDGSFAPPSGRFSTLRPITGGYELVDKEGTEYIFTVLKSTGVYGLTAVADAAGRTLTLTYTSGKVTQMTGASGRRLNLTWSGSNVATVANEAGDTWGYTYTSGLLTKVCPPTSTTACHRYEYGNNSLHPTAVLDAQPHTYWRLNEPVGAQTAQSSVVDNPDTGRGNYTNVTLGVTGPLPAATGWTPPKAASFNGTSSYVDLSQSKVAMKRSVQTVSLWFKTASSGVLLSYQDSTLASGASGTYNPVLYVDVNGFLRTGFWPLPAIVSSGPVNNNAWHHAVLASSGTGQQLWLDGISVGTSSGTADLGWANYMYLGAGKWAGLTATSGTNGYFNGSIAEFAFFDRPLSGAQAKTMYDAGTTVAKPLTKVIRPSNGVSALVEYDAVSGIVKKLTDEHNGVWTINPPVISGTSAVHSSTVLASAPADYFRMVDADNEVNGSPATFNSVTFGGANAGPLGDTAGSFNGTSSYVLIGQESVNTTQPFSVSAWVKLDVKDVDRYVMVMPAPIGSSFRLRYDFDGNRWQASGKGTRPDNTQDWWYVNTPAGLPQVGQWTHLVVTADPATSVIKLYVDGVEKGSITSTIPLNNRATGARIGSEYGESFWDGLLAETAMYQSVLSPAQVKAQFEARDKAANGGAGDGVAVKTVSVVDPGAKTTSYVYDLTNGGRQVRQVDSLGGVTTYGFDTGGFLHTTTDPNGNLTVEEHDVRGNVIAKTTCQDRSENKCSTVYTSYYPDESTKVLTPDPRNDTPMTVGDGRSGSKDDATYRTTNDYDAQGNLTSVTDPLGRVTRTDYTTAGDFIPHDHTGLTGSGRYVRILGTLRGTTVNYSLRDWQVYGPTGGNLALDRDVVASSATLSVDSATDGSPLTRWASASTDNEWIYVDLGATKTIGRVFLLWNSSYGKNYQIQVSSDATGWTTIKTVTGAVATATPAGLPIQQISPGGAVQRTYYSARGDVVRTVDATWLENQFEYDSLGRLTKKTVAAPSGDQATVLTYDKLNRVLTQTDPAVLNRVTGATHTAVTTMGYDVDGNTISQTVADSTGGDATRSASNSYNTLGQLASTTDALNKIRTFTYDLYGNKVSETDPTGARMEYTYDAPGQLTKTTLKNWTGDPNNPSAPTDLIVESRAYDPAGRLASVTDAMGWQTLYAYTDNGLAATLTRKNPVTSATFVAESNVYDAAGNLIEKVSDNGTTRETFAVDAAGRVSSHTVDPSGLKRTTVYTVNADDDVVAVTNKDAASAVVGYSETMYDLAGREVASTAFPVSGLTPVGRWKLNESSGPVAADSAGNTPIPTTSVTWTNDAVRGQVASFNGTTSKIVSDAEVVDSTRDFTVAAWVKLAVKDGQRYAVAMRGSNNFSAFKLGYRQSTDTWLTEMHLNKTDGTRPVVTVESAGGLPQIDTWTHLAVAVDVDTKTIKLYVNGVLSGSLTTTHVFGNRAQDLYIGDHFGSLKWSGAISDVQVYQKDLSATEIGNVRTGAAPAASAKVVRTSQQVGKDGLVTAAKDANGNVTKYEYDAADQPTVTTSPSVLTEENGGTPVAAMAVQTLGYNNFGEVTEQRDAKGKVTTTIRDAVGQATESRMPSYTPPGSSTAINPVSKMEYDSFGQPTKTIDPLLHETTRVYDQLGRLAKVTAPNGGVTKYTYTLNGEPLSVTDPNGARSETTYDHMGRQITSTRIERSPAASFVTSYAYNTAGRLLSTTPPGRNPITYEYNVAGEVTKVTDGAGNATRSDYDALGRRSATTEADNAKQTVAYDFAGRPVTQQRLSPTGTVLATKSTTYDAQGQVMSTTDARGNTTSFSYDATGLVTQMVEPVSATESITTSFGYDIAGRPTRFTDGRNNKFVTTYNPLGLVESEIEPDGATFTTIYDANGQAVTRNEPGGVTVTNAYNNMGQLIGQTGSGADATTAERTYDYNLGGQMTLFGEGGNESTVSYNDRGLVTGVTGASGSSAFTWTGDGLMASRQDASGTSSFGYDAAGRLSTVADAASAEQLTFAYNNLNQATTLTYGASGNRRSFGYDGLRHLTSDGLSTSGSVGIASITYGYDANGNLTSKTTTGFAGSAANTYTYDKANRLTSWNSTNYGYDKSGNRTAIGSRTFTYDTRNRLTSDSNITYTYSDRGTLTGTTEGTVTTPSTFDAYGQQIGQGTQTYAYDGVGRVLSAASGAVFTYSGTGNDLASDGTAVYGRGPGGNVVGTKQGTTAGRLVWTDRHTDVVAEFTSTGTTLSGSRAYNPVGVVLASTAMSGNLGYQSGWTDPATSRVNMHARWYNPATAQFASRDSVAVSAMPSSVRANRYAYGDGNPLTVTDPTGHCGFCSWVRNKVSAGVNKVASVAASAWNTATSYVSSAYDWVKEKVTQAYNWVSEKVSQVSNWVSQKVSQVKNWAVKKYNQVKEQAKQAYQAAKQAVVEGAKRAAAATKAAAQAVYEAGKKYAEAYVQTVKDAYKATANWIEEHKAEIAGFVVGAVVGIGCGVLIGWTGVGAVACGMLAGAAGSFVTGAIQGKRGWDLVATTAIGGLSGALGGGVGGFVGGKVAGLVAGKLGGGLISRVAGGMLSGAASGGAAGAAEGGMAGAMGYGMQCMRSGSCTAKGFLGAAGSGAAQGAKWGALAGGIGGGFGGLNKGGGSQKGGGPGCHSFDPDTKVLLASGAAVAISAVKLGDAVLATDPETGNTEAKPVTALHTNQDKDLTDLTVTVEDGQDTGEQVTLNTTWHHPFWDATDGKWVDAADLEPGHELLVYDNTKEQLETGTVGTGQGGGGPPAAHVTVNKVHNYIGSKTMHDLTVGDIHTYYVIAGDMPVLVHNCDKAIVHWDSDEGHAVMELRIGDASYKSDFRMTDSIGSTVARDLSERSGLGMTPDLSLELDLPNMAGARAEQMQSIGPGEIFSYENNSCLTHCARILRAGGHPDFQSLDDTEITDTLIYDYIPPDKYDHARRRQGY